MPDSSLSDKLSFIAVAIGFDSTEFINQGSLEASRSPVRFIVNTNAFVAEI